MPTRNVKTVSARASQADALHPAVQESVCADAVDGYIARQASFALPILRHLRSAVHEAAPGSIEHIKWSRPFFAIEGTLLAYMAAFKEHCGFGFWSPEMTMVLAADGITEPGASGSFGRIVSLDDLPPRETLLRYIRHAAGLARTGVGGSSMPARTRRASARAPIPVPREFTAALEDAAEAKVKFDGMAPSCRREYVHWITSAKKPETRDRRIADAITRLNEGKRFNEQYRST